MRRTALIFAGLVASVLVAAILGICLGPVRVPVRDVAAILLGHGDGGVAQRIVLDVRLPRVFMGACVGVLLGTAGVLLQGFLRNPLAEPYLLGVSSGAGLAVTAAIILGMPMFVAGVYVLPPIAFAGALAALALVYFLARSGGRLEVTTLILAGVVTGSILSSVATLLACTSTARYFEAFFWLMGHLQPATGSARGWVAAYTVAGILFALARARDLNALMLGEEEAAALGVRVEALKRDLFVISSLLVGAAVSVSGLIGFVGLVAPHLTRLLLGPDHRRLIPASALGGAALLLLADLVARLVIAPAELPVGVVTALVGGPFFLFLLVRHSRSVKGRRA